MIQAQTAAVSTSSAVTVDKTGIDPLTGTYGNYNLGIVKIQEGIVSGDGCYDNSGNIIVLISNKNATDPTYAQLVQYLNSDTTDEYPYISTGNIQGTICGSAESLVNLVHIQKIIDGTARPTRSGRLRRFRGEAAQRCRDGRYQMRLRNHQIRLQVSML